MTPETATALNTAAALDAATAPDIGAALDTGNAVDAGGPFLFLPGFRDDVTPERDDLVVASTPAGMVAVTPAGGLPRVADVDIVDLRYLGRLHARPVWAGPLKIDSTLDEALATRSWVDLSLELGPPVDAVVVRGVYDVRWSLTHRFCGECGGALVDCPGFPTRRCPSCETLRFVPQQMSPVVLLAIVRAGSILLVRHSYGPGLGIWALVAGFVEAGETLEAAAAREAWEEVGLNVTDLRYVASRPWSVEDAAVLMTAFIATCADDGFFRVDGVELTDARWFTRAETAAMPPEDMPPPSSLAWRLIEVFLAG